MGIKHGKAKRVDMLSNSLRESPPPPIPSPPEPLLPPPPVIPGATFFDSCLCMCYADDSEDALHDDPYHLHSVDLTSDLNLRARATTPLPHSTTYAARGVVVRGISREVMPLISIPALSEDNFPANNASAREAVEVQSLRLSVAHLATNRRQRANDNRGGLTAEASARLLEVCPYGPSDAGEYNTETCVAECSIFLRVAPQYALAYVVVERGATPNATGSDAAWCRCYQHKVPLGNPRAVPSYFPPSDQQALRWLERSTELGGPHDDDYDVTGKDPNRCTGSEIFLAHRRPPGSELDSPYISEEGILTTCIVSIVTSTPH